MLMPGSKKLHRNRLFQFIDDFRIQMRMEKAKELLEQTEKSVKEISILLGYKSMGSFSTMFKKMFRLSPTQWRNAAQG
jgi:AraC-like DNA-binding protein